MARQTVGYYTSRKEKLLRDFDITTSLLRTSLLARYGEEFANRLQREVRQHYEELIPEIPYIRGPRAGSLNTFLLISAQELAAYKAMKKHGKSQGETWELCHEALRSRLARFPQWKRRLMRRFMFSSVVRRIVARRSRKKQKHLFGGFEIEYVIGQGDDFDFGVNYLQRGNYRFVVEQGGAQFAPYVCMSDIALSEAMGWGLTRSQTLADGCAYCDFRFRKGAATRISSKTPEVQQTIERIQKKEAEPSAAGDADKPRV